MKVAIILIGFLVAVAFAQDGKVLFPNCPDFKLTYPELKAKVHMDHVLGPWSMIRKGPCEDPSKFAKYDCMRELFYRDDNTPENTINFVMHARNETGHKVCSGTTKFTGLEGDQIDNFFEHEFKDPEDTTKLMKSQSVLIDTDDGETWGLWSSCIEFTPTNKTVVWGIVSRYPWIDARVEQRLVERVEKYGGVGPTQLRGIGQTDCYKQKH